MSNIASLRSSIKTWLTDIAKPDAWQLDPPANLFSPDSTMANIKASSVGIQYPAESLQLAGNDGALIGEVKLAYQFVRRYANSLGYHELPIGSAEALLELIQASALISPPSGLLRFQPSAGSVQVARRDDAQSDWLVYVNIGFTAAYSVTDLAIGPDPFVDEFSIDLWKSPYALVGNKLASTLDTQIPKRDE